MQTRRDMLLNGGAALFSPHVEGRSRRGGSRSCEEHTAWVAAVMTRMQSIKQGMTRKTLLHVFTTEGGLSGALAQTYVSRDCPYSKVDVVFSAEGRPAKEAGGRATLNESERDVILSLSRPYLEFSVAD